MLIAVNTGLRRIASENGYIKKLTVQATIKPASKAQSGIGKSHLRITNQSSDATPVGMMAYTSDK
jgi:hypothetical protein